MQLALLVGGRPLTALDLAPFIVDPGDQVTEVTSLLSSVARCTAGAGILFHEFAFSQLKSWICYRAYVRVMYGSRFEEHHLLCNYRRATSLV